MNNNYKTPESNLELNKEGSNRPHTMWRVFFWINLVMLPLTLIAVTMLPGLSYLDYIDMALFSFTVLGIFSYSYNKKILPNKIWMLTCVIYLLWYVSYEFIGPLVFEMTHYGEPAVIDEYLIISLLFFVPTMYALYSISFKSNIQNNSNS